MLIKPAKLAASFLVGLGALAQVGCISYHAAPLPDAASLATRATPDIASLRLAVAELDHPRLAPVEIDLTDGLSPDEAAVLAVLGNPDLLAARAARGETAAQLVVAGLLPAPTFSYQQDHPYGTGADGTVDAVSAGLEVDLTALVERSARVAEGRATLEGVEVGIAWQEWQVAQSARLQVVRIGWLGRRRALTRDELTAEEETLGALQAAMDRGDATLGDVGLQLASVDALRRSGAELRQTELEARAELDRLLGLPGTALLDVQLSPEDTPMDETPAPLDSDQLTTQAIEERLDLQALRRGYEAQEAAVRGAVLAQLPGLTVGVAAQRNESALRFFGGFVSLGLPFFGHPRAQISLQEATRARLGLELEARAFGARAEIHALVRRLDELGSQAVMAAQAVDRLKPVMAATRVAASQGDMGRLEEQAVRSAWLEARLERLAVAQAQSETWIGLETAVGTLSIGMR